MRWAERRIKPMTGNKPTSTRVKAGSEARAHSPSLVISKMRTHTTIRMLAENGIQHVRTHVDVTDLTHQQEIWFQEGCLHQAMRASAAIPSLFTLAMQGNRMLVDGGLLNPLPIVPVVSSHCDLIVAVNLNSTTQNHYQLPVIPRPAAFKGRFNNLMNSLGSHIPFRTRQAEHLLDLEQEMLKPATEPEAEVPFNPWIDSATPKPAPSLATNTQGAPKSATGSVIIDNVGPASLLDLINQSFEVMQTSLAQYKIAGYPPDILINVPKRVCRFFEFYKAAELIALGREIAKDTLDRYEADQRSQP